MKHLPGQSLQPNRHGVVGALAVCCLLAGGCAQRLYRASHLPVEYAAPAPSGIDGVNFGRLGASSGPRDVIAWGDLLSVQVDPGLTTTPMRSVEVRVGRDGTVGVPLVGRVPVAGMEVEHAEQAVAAAARARDIYPNAFVALRIVKPRENYVTVVGAVEKPGTYPLPRGNSSLLAALVAAGGVSKAACGDVEIRHTDPRLLSPGVMQASGSAGARPVSHETPLTPVGEVVLVNLVTASGDGGGNRTLEDGDVVNVVKRDLPPIHVLGLVNRPGMFPMNASHEIRLLDSVAMAGGCSSRVADRVDVVRHVPGEDAPITIQASIQRAIRGPDNVLLAPGDTVIVRQTLETISADLLKQFIRIGIGGSIALF
ncbi:MAG: SLBB domain-containing protein [Pirellulales bacterium]|nr:SLBB domain-containing protein [Pirellulales bacterium]